jgi:hypothetical protein
VVLKIYQNVGAAAATARVSGIAIRVPEPGLLRNGHGGKGAAVALVAGRHQKGSGPADTARPRSQRRSGSRSWSIAATKLKSTETTSTTAASRNGAVNVSGTSVLSTSACVTADGRNGFHGVVVVVDRPPLHLGDREHQTTHLPTAAL